MKNPMTPLKQELVLQKKVQKAVEDNPDVSLRQTAKRFGIGEVRLRNLLKDEIPYPGSYKIAAKRTGLPIEFVTEYKEKGHHWCPYCEDAFSREQFRDGGTEVSRHTAKYCVKYKKK